MYRSKHHRGAARRDGRVIPALPSGPSPTKPERLTQRLLDLLSSLGVSEDAATDADTRSLAASG
jgi:hypothetical protein